MPNTASAKKRLRQDVVRRSRNRAVKSVLRRRLRDVRAAVTSGDLTKADDLLRLAVKSLDRAAGHRVVHPNTAARYKSRLQHLIVKAKAAK